MRKVLIAAALAVATISTAQAADNVPVRQYTPVYMQPAPVLTWAGPYLGLQGGVASGNSTVDLDFTGFGTIASQTAKGSGAFGGLFGGWRWQNGPIVYGIQGDFNFGGPRGSTNLFGVDGSFKTKWNASVGPTVGYAVSQNFLLSVFGGLNVTRVGFDANGLGIAESWTQTKTGWTIGAEALYRLGQNWFAGIDYRYVDSGTLSHDLASVPGLAVNNKLTSHAAMIKLGYLF